MRGRSAVRVLALPVFFSIAAGFTALPLSAGTGQAKPSQAKPSQAKPSQATPSAKVLKNPIPMSEASVKAGRVAYAKICRNCHGLQAKGDGPTAPPGSKPANLTDAEWKHGSSDGEIFMTIKQGIKPFDVMEPWGKKLTDTEIWNIINFLRDLAAKSSKPKK
jgi:mono/diheme cytochrome c family protein